MKSILNQPEKCLNSSVLNDDVVDLDADYYTKHSFLQNNLAKELLDSFQVDPCACILDIGGGEGRLEKIRHDGSAGANCRGPSGRRSRASDSTPC